MAIDLSDLVDNLKRETNPPGQVIFPDAGDADYEGYLSDSFWEMTLRGYITGYTAVDTVVSPDSGTTELTRSLQQLIIINAAMSILRIQLVNIETGFRTVAGPVEFETQRSAQAIRGVLDALNNRFDSIIDGLPSVNEGHPTYYGDVSYLRSAYGDPYFTGY